MEGNVLQRKDKTFILLMVNKIYISEKWIKMLKLIVWGTEEQVKNRNMYSLYTDKSNKIFGLRMKLKHYQKKDARKKKSTNSSVKIFERKYTMKENNLPLFKLHTTFLKRQSSLIKERPLGSVHKCFFVFKWNVQLMWNRASKVRLWCCQVLSKL